MSPPDNSVYQLQDLAHWPVTECDLAVVGHPVKHSLSPVMHNAALAVMGRLHPLFLSWRYHAFDIPPEQISQALPAFRAAGFRGVNWTVPHKQVILPYLAEIDPEAARMGAVNTIVPQDSGWRGYNTDGYGIEQAVRESFGYGFAGKRVILVGAGGAARAAAVQILLAGVSGLIVLNRTRERLDDLITVLRKVSGRGQEVTGLPGLVLPPATPADLLINATSCGLRREDPLPIDPTSIPAGCDVFDMIYNPAETGLLKAARQGGHRAANGLGMLVHQGVRSLELWTGKPVPVEAMFLALAQKGFSPNF